MPKLEEDMRMGLPTFQHGAYHFADYPKFRPNLSPKQVLQAGSFGGTYFRPIKSAVCPEETFGKEVYEEFPKDWFEGLDVETQVCSLKYRKEVNKYGVKAGASLEEWEKSGWIKPQDPYGYFQWYCRFFLGRRTEDDERQIARYLNCAGEKGRWRTRLCKLVFMQRTAFDDEKVSPVIRQTLLHWGYELTQADYLKWGQSYGAEDDDDEPSSRKKKKQRR